MTPVRTVNRTLHCAPLRRILPPMGGLDLAPLVALLAIIMIRIILTNNIGLFY